MQTAEPVEPARRKKADLVADHIKHWIMLEGLGVGDRLPPEETLVRRLGVSRGTMREALKSLEVQGLLQVKAGRGGGPRVVSVSDDVSIELLGNHFFSRDLSVKDVYAVRRILEPEMAAQVFGRLGDAEFEALDHSIGLCSCEPAGLAARHRQRQSELDFHDVLASACPNPLLAFNCKFMNRLLGNLAVCRKIFLEDAKDLAAGARHYHARLVEAYRTGSAGHVRQLMHEHMLEAEAILARYEAVIENRFIMNEERRDHTLP